MVRGFLKDKAVLYRVSFAVVFGLGIVEEACETIINEGRVLVGN